MIFAIAGVFLFLTALCIVSALFPSSWIYAIRNVPLINAAVEIISAMSHPTAFAAVISLVGVTGVLTSLIASTDREVSGVALATLIQRAYPGTYTSYFFLFLPLVILGIYAGTFQRKTASVMAACGLLILIPYLLRVCYLVLLNRESREEIIYKYYQDVLQNVEDAPSDCGAEQADWREIYATVQNVSLTAQKLLTECSRIQGSEILKAWQIALEKHLPKESMDARAERMGVRYYTGKICGEVSAAIMMENAWKTLFAPPMTSYLRRIATTEILFDIGWKEHRSLSDLIVMAGLVLAVADLCASGENQLQASWMEFLQIIGPLGVQEDNQNYVLDLQADLIRAFGMVVAVDVLQNRNPQWVREKNPVTKELWKSIVDILPAKEERDQVQWEMCQIIDYPVLSDGNGFSLWERDKTIILHDSVQANRELLMWIVEWVRSLKYPSYCGFPHINRIDAHFRFYVPPCGESLYHPWNLCFHELLLTTLFD